MYSSLLASQYQSLGQFDKIQSMSRTNLQKGQRPSTVRRVAAVLITVALRLLSLVQDDVIPVGENIGVSQVTMKALSEAQENQEQHCRGSKARQNGSVKPWIQL